MPRKRGSAGLPSGSDEGNRFAKGGYVLGRDGNYFVFGVFARFPMTEEEIRRQKLNEGYQNCFLPPEGFIPVISKNLAEARKRAGYTQESVSAITGIAIASLRRYESGEREPNVSLLARLACLYGTSVDRILGIIDATEEHLLDCYRYSCDASRKAIVADAERHQSNYAVAESEWESQTREIRRRVDEGTMDQKVLDIYLAVEKRMHGEAYWPYI